MMRISLFVLVIQIGFHAALNNRGYSSNPLIPTARMAHSGQTRRLADSESSESDEVVPESFEDYRFRSFQPVQNPYQKRNDYLRYSTRSENDVSLETAPVGRMNSINYAERVQSSSSSSRRTDPTFRRSYSAYGPSYLEQGLSRKYHRNGNDDSSFEVSSLEVIESTDLGQTNLNNRRHGDGFELNDDVFNNLSPFRGQKPGSKSRKLTNDSPLTRRFSRKSNRNSRSSLRDEMFPDDDKTGKLTFLRLSSLEDLNLESPLLRSHDENGLNNRKSNSRNVLRLSLAPNNKLTLDEGIASDLSELLFETLDELHLVPVSLRRKEPSSNKYSRRENKRSDEEDDFLNPSDLRLGSIDIPNSELPIRRYSEPAHRIRKKNLRYHGNNTAALKKLFDEDTTKTLVPYHEVKSKKLPNSIRNGDQKDNRRDDFSDEFSLDTLFEFRKEDLDDKLSSHLSVLSSTDQDNLSLKSSVLRSSDENESKPTDTLILEYPWTDELSHKNKTNGLRSQKQLRNGEENYKTKDSTEILQLEYPWTDKLSPSKNENSELRSLTQLRNGEKEDKTRDSSDTLHLEFPCNDELSPVTNQSGNSKTNLRSPKDEAKDTTDTLHLEYPWNDSLSPHNNKSSKQSGLRSKLLLRSPKEDDNAKDTTDTLHLEFPWNDELSPDNNKRIKQYFLPGVKSKSQLRSSKQKVDKKDTTDVLHLKYPWNDQLSPDNNKNTQLRSHDQEDNGEDTTDTIHLENPWNEELGPDENKTGKSKSPRRQTDSRQDKEPKDELKLEFPWNDKTRSSKKTAVRTPDPFYVHPYLRNRNIKKHPNYFRRFYDEFSERLKLENHKNSPLQRTNRRLIDNLRVLPIARAGPENNKLVFKSSDSVESPSAVITFPSNRRQKRLRVRSTRRQNNDIPPLVTITESVENLDGNKKTYNDTIIISK